MENLNKLLDSANNDLKTVMIYLYTMIVCSDTEHPDFCKNVKTIALTLLNVAKLCPQLKKDKECQLIAECACPNIQKYMEFVGRSR